MVEQGLSRRRFLGASAALGAAAFFTMAPVSRSIAAALAPSGSPLLGFKAVPSSTADTVVVPEGYQVERLISWGGDPLFADVAEFSHQLSHNTAANQKRQFGDNNDGMSLFPVDEQTAILAVNNEYTNYELMFEHQGKSMTAADVQYAQAAHGVSVISLAKQAQGWRFDKNGRFNRRIDANTPMRIGGPARGHALLQTKADPKGGRDRFGGNL